MHFVFALAAMDVNVQVVDDHARVIVTQDYRNTTPVATYGDFVVRVPRGGEVAGLRIDSEHARLLDAPATDTYGGLLWRHVPVVRAGGDIRVQMVLDVPVRRDEDTRSLVVPIGENPRFLYSGIPADGAQVTVTVESDHDRIEFVGATEPGVVLKVGEQAKSWTGSVSTMQDLQLAWMETDVPTLAEAVLAKFPPVAVHRTPADAERRWRHGEYGATPAPAGDGSGHDVRTIVLQWVPSGAAAG